MNDHISHHGIKGQKWGVRRYQNYDGTRTAAGKRRFTPTSVSAWKAKRENDKIDKSFHKWKESDRKRDDAIASGKNRNLAKRAVLQNPGDKETKQAYKEANRQYKKDLRQNKTHRKGIVSQEVGYDMSRKYLSEAKAVKKKLDADPGNRQLAKQYNSLMSKQAVERKKARTAVARTKASDLRKKTVASLAGGVALTAGARFVDKKMYEKNGTRPVADVAWPIIKTGMSVLGSFNSLRG